MEFLDQQIAFGLTGMQILMIVGSVVIISIIIQRVMSKKERADMSGHLVMKRCSSCGWAGKVSSFNKSCPKCKSAIN